MNIDEVGEHRINGSSILKIDPFTVCTYSSDLTLDEQFYSRKKVKHNEVDKM